MQIELDKIQLPINDLRADVDADSLDELADSLNTLGQLQAIGVKELGDGNYEVVFGARRTRAARLINWKSIRAEVLEMNADINPEAQKLIENVQRDNLTPMEEAFGLVQLVGEEEPDIRKLRRQTGKSAEWIRSRFALVSLPDDIQGAVQAGVIGIGVARLLGQIENDIVREQYTRYAVEHGCTEQNARIWVATARSATSGVVTMEEFNARQKGQIEGPEIAEMTWPCNCCNNRQRAGEFNTMLLCYGCQDLLNTTRHTLERFTDRQPDTEGTVTESIAS